MKGFRMLLYLLLLVVFTNTKSSAQVPSTDSLLSKALQTDQLLPMLIDSAIKYSPVVRRMANSVNFADENLQMNKKNIYSSLSLISSYNYGTNYSAVNNATGSSLNNFTTSQTGFYNMGIGIQLPLTQILSRKNLIRSGVAQVNIATADKDNAELYVKQEVIRIYQEFKLSHKLVMIGSKNKESAQVNYAMAEKEFLNGQSSVDQEARVWDIYNKSIIEYETYLNRFQTAFMQLESYTGTSLSSLIKQVK